MTKTELVQEMLVYSPFKYLMWLLSQGGLLKLIKSPHLPLPYPFHLSNQIIYFYETWYTYYTTWMYYQHHTLLRMLSHEM
jgi:hypothetical protein